MTEHKVLAG